MVEVVVDGKMVVDGKSSSSGSSSSTEDAIVIVVDLELEQMVRVSRFYLCSTNNGQITNIIMDMPWTYTSGSSGSK